ncbi:MAG: nucleotidyltransferase domain-containing protein [Anaerolineales bacterium]
MSRGKRSLASRLTKDLILDERVKAVLLIGSVARGIDSEDSDLDIAVFTQSLPTTPITTEVIAGTRVGIESFCTRAFPGGASTPLLHLQDLRDCGRFATGEVLYSRWPRLQQVQQAWLKALLHPQEAAELFTLAVTYLNPQRVQACSSSPDRLWMVQGAAAAFATLALSLCPIRFQKPKWVMRDLKAANQTDLLESIAQLFFAGKVDLVIAQTVLRSTKKALLAGLQSAGLPPLTVVEDMHNKYPYIYRTFQDAVSLERDGDFEGCAYTSLYSLRLLNALLQDQAALPRTLTNAQVAKWRHRALTSVCPPCSLSLQDLENCMQKLRAYGERLEKCYRCKYLEAKNIEIPRQRWAVPHPHEEPR